MSVEGGKFDGFLVKDKSLLGELFVAARPLLETYTVFEIGGSLPSDVYQEKVLPLRAFYIEAADALGLTDTVTNTEWLHMGIAEKVPREVLESWTRAGAPHRERAIYYLNLLLKVS